MLKEFLNWFLEPFINTTPSEQVIYESTPYVEPIKPIELPKDKNTFRPNVFDGYIGQKRAKSILKTYIKEVKIRGTPLPHLLISGKAGYGKTTLARLVANELKVDFKELLGPTVEDFYYLMEYIENLKGGMLFIDEIHAIPRNKVEGIYSVMEDFAFEGEKIEPFTLIGATTELGEIIKNRKPFYDRFKIIIELEDYTLYNLASIVSQYKNNKFPKDKLTEKDYKLIAKNCKGTPRKAIRLLEASIYFKNVNKVLKNFGIIKNGYTKTDLEVLKYLKLNKSGVGVDSICGYLETSRDNYLFEIEMWLLKTKALIRTPKGRKLTEHGEKLIKMLSKYRR